MKRRLVLASCSYPVVLRRAWSGLRRCFSLPPPRPLLFFILRAEHMIWFAGWCGRHASAIKLREEADPFSMDLGALKPGEVVKVLEVSIGVGRTEGGGEGATKQVSNPKPVVLCFCMYEGGSWAFTRKVRSPGCVDVPRWVSFCAALGREAPSSSAKFVSSWYPRSSTPCGSRIPSLSVSPPRSLSACLNYLS